MANIENNRKLMMEQIKNVKSQLNEADDYYKTASAAADAAREMAEKRGFEIDEDD